MESPHGRRRRRSRRRPRRNLPMLLHLEAPTVFRGVYTLRHTEHNGHPVWKKSRTHAHIYASKGRWVVGFDDEMAEGKGGIVSAIPNRGDTSLPHRVVDWMVYSTESGTW
eukprot:Sspe_Gene.119210::Locus_114541_Transcript_1_1_Confidence_1.000_Length_359::g.119210::m.119210